MEFTFEGAKYRLERSRYFNDRLAVIVLDEGGKHVARLSVNFPDHPEPPEGVFYLKDWSENEALATFLLQEGYLELAVDCDPIACGHVMSEPVRIAS